MKKLYKNEKKKRDKWIGKWIYMQMRTLCPLYFTFYKYQRVRDVQTRTKNVNDWSPYLVSNLTPNYAIYTLHLSVISRVCWQRIGYRLYIYTTLTIDVTDIHNDVHNQQPTYFQANTWMMSRNIIHVHVHTLYWIKESRTYDKIRSVPCGSHFHMLWHEGGDEKLRAGWGGGGRDGSRLDLRKMWNLS